jgi:hypothetical protein
MFAQISLFLSRSHLFEHRIFSLDLPSQLQPDFLNDFILLIQPKLHPFNFFCIDLHDVLQFFLHLVELIMKRIVRFPQLF